MFIERKGLGYYEMSIDQRPGYYEFLGTLSQHVIVRYGLKLHYL